MKKILLCLVGSVCLFGASVNERLSNLENEVKNLKQEVSLLQSKVDKLTNSQKKIEVKVQKNTILSCNKIKLVKFTYKYNGGYMPSYDLYYTLKNNYKKTVTYLIGGVSIYDNEDNDLIEDFIKQNVTLKPNQTITLHTTYMIDTQAGLSKYLKETPLKDLTVKLKLWNIKFSDNTKIKCNN